MLSFFNSVVFNPYHLDPTLTHINILKATRNVHLWTSEESLSCLEMPCRQHDAIVEKFDREQAKEEVITTWLRDHPCPTWKHIMKLLQWLERVGKASREEAAKVEREYITSKLCYSTHVT